MRGLVMRMVPSDQPRLRTTRPGHLSRGLWRCCGLLAAVLGVMSGCGGSQPVATYPVKGKVLVGGEPAAGAFVVFHPRGGAPAPGVEKPTAQVGADGSFQLTTFDAADGAPSGPYTVTVEWYRLVGKGNDVQAGPNVVPPEYGKPESTPIQVTVSEGDNALEPFQITPTRRR